MIEKRARDEADHYNKRIQRQTDFFQNQWMGKYPFVPACYRFLAGYLVGKCKGKKVLDYGCGYGLHSFWIAELGAEVTGVDLSEESLKIAEEKKKALGPKIVVNFLPVDCENLKLNNSFDIIFEDGVFPSLDLEKALPEVVKVLKKEGFFIGIETFGHNPLANFNRRLNIILGKRTSWEVSHIFSLKDIELVKLFFGKIEIYYFHPASWLIFPFLKYRFGKYLLKFLEIIDNILLKLPFLRKYSFKVVFIFSKPKK